MTFVVVTLAYEPAKNTGKFVRRFRVFDPAVACLAIGSDNVVPGYGSPVGFFSDGVGPALDAGKQAFDAGAVAANAVAVSLIFVNNQAAFLVAYPKAVGIN